MWATTDGHDTFISTVLRTKAENLPGRFGLLCKTAVHRMRPVSMLVAPIEDSASGGLSSLVQYDAQVHAREILCVVNSHRLLAPNRRSSASLGGEASHRESDASKVVSMPPRSVLRL